MRLSHNQAVTPIFNELPLEQLKQSLLREFDSLKPGESDFCATEANIISLFMSAASNIISQFIERHDVDKPTVEFEGRTYTKCTQSKRDYFTAAGKCKVKRTLYQHPFLSKTICPLDTRLGTIRNNWTPKAAKQAALVAAELSPYTAEKLFQEIGGMKPSKSSLDRLPKAIGQYLEINRDYFNEQLLKQSHVPSQAAIMAISLDGVHIPIQKLKGKSRYRSTIDFATNQRKIMDYYATHEYSRYREASCGTITFYSKHGELLETRQYGRMPEEGKKTLKQLLYNHAKTALLERPDLNVITIADGARDNWTFFEEKFPEATQILDFYHAAQHLQAAIDSFLSTNPEEDLFGVYRKILRYEENGIDEVLNFLINRLEGAPDNKALEREINYFKNNRERCFYQIASDKNFPIGSGIVEATCKTLVTQRMKQSGMAWQQQGGQAILDLRSILHSRKFDLFWDNVVSAATSYQAA